MTMTNPRLTEPQEKLLKTIAESFYPRAVASYYKPLARLKELKFVVEAGGDRYVVSDAGRAYLKRGVA